MPKVIARFKLETEKLKNLPLTTMIARKAVGYFSKEHKIYDLKFRESKIWFRFPFIIRGRTVIILDGFNKDTDRIEQFDLERAIGMASQYK